MKINSTFLQNWHCKYGALFLLILSAILLRSTALNITEDVLTKSNGSKTKYTFPNRVSSSDDVEYYVYTGTINKSWYSQRTVRLIPDDRVFYIKINGNIVPEYGIAFSQSMNMQNGFACPLAEHLTNGCNSFEISIADLGKGVAGLSIRSSVNDPLFMTLYCVFILSLGMVFRKILKSFGLSSGLSGIATIPLIVGMLYFLYNEYWENGYDIEGHLAYIEYIMSYGHIPDRNELWLSYHPPVYFHIAAEFYNMIRILGIDNLAVSCQILAMILFMIFIGYSMLTIDRLVKTPWGKIAAGLLFSALPASILHFPRIGNDSLLYALSGAVLFYIIVWNQKKQHQYILTASGLALISVFVKTNGILLVAITLVTLGLHVLNCKGKMRIYWGASLVCLTLLMAASYKISTSNIGRPNSQKGGTTKMIGNASSLNKVLSVGNNAQNMLSFNYRIYLNEPFTSPWIDGKGRNYFANFALKTFLFGEYSSEDPVKRNLAKALSILLLPLIAASLLAYAPILIDGIRTEHLIISAYLALSIAALFYVRYTIPFACSGDARFIYPAAVSWVVLIGWLIDSHHTGLGKGLAGTTSIMICIFAALSIALNLYPLHNIV